MEEFSFETHPDRYRHWNLSVEGDTARLAMNVQRDAGLRPGYDLKLNSYDLGVDIELADAIRRLRFEHPSVKVVILESAIERVFCAGANIPMLASSTHAFKVNFCKFTNETRLELEDASEHSGIKSIAALEGTCAGGGYELALAADEMMLVDDGSSAVSLPEVPLLAVLPGTGGLTRLVDKRKVRRDRADVFCTTSEGLRGKKALGWGLVDGLAPRSRFAEALGERVTALAATVDKPARDGHPLEPLEPKVGERSIEYRHLTLELDHEERVATLTLRAPREEDDLRGWSLRAFRELDDAILRLRFHHGEIGLIVLHTRGGSDRVLAADAALAEAEAAGDWLAKEIRLFQARTLRRLDVSSKSVFALADEHSCFSGVFLELLLAADRSYMLEEADDPVCLALGPANFGAHPTHTGLTRLETHFYGEPERVDTLRQLQGKPLQADDAVEHGVVTMALDDIDWEDDVRIAIEERASLSPDALTGMEASLRFPGPETLGSKIFARLSAWQNWIFQRPNAVGEEGALTRYGEPERPRFDWRRC